MNRPYVPRARAAAGSALLVAWLIALPVAAQHHDHHDAHVAPSAGLRAELIRDLESVADKFLGLADATRDHYDWRPGEGVRSVREVLTHMAAGNFLIANLAGVPLPDGMTMEQVRGLAQLTDPGEIREALDHSFRHAAHGIGRTPEDTLDDPVTLFGRETTRRGALLLLVTHAHEHLGQAIAYARTNGVVPPWSGGG
jgi:uncharacterized damage-inducible protein DinB